MKKKNYQKLLKAQIVWTG